jgi:hypothetical protein
MPYYPPPDFQSGAVLTAAQMNILTEDTNHFFNLSEYLHPPFASQSIGSDHYARRKHRYLHWKYTIPAGGSYATQINLYVNSNLVISYTSSGQRVGPATVTGSHDFNSDAKGTSAGNWYHIETTHGSLTGDAGTIWYFLESDASSLSAGSGSAGSYTSPPQWIHFAAQIAESPTPPEYNVPSAALMNRYRSAQNEIDTRMGPHAVNFAVGQIDDDNYAMLIHRYQWLHYREAGTLTDINLQNSVSLSSDDDNVYYAYNLDSIPWMTPGTLYLVTGCVMAAESVDP